MINTEWRTSPSGNRWEFVRSWKERGRYVIVCARSELGAMRYLSEDEWEDWPLA